MRVVISVSRSPFVSRKSTVASTRATSILLALLLLIPASSLSAQALAPVAPTSTVVTEFEVNGLKVLVKQRPSTQTVIAGLFFRGGVANLTSETAGLEALMLDVASEGSVAYPREKLRREMSRTGAQVMADATYDYSVLSVATPMAHFADAWKVFVDVALHPAFDPNDFARLQDRRLTLLSGRDETPEAYLDVLQNRTAFAGHPYQGGPNGTLESVRNITLDAIKRHHQQAMVTSRLLLVIVGNIDVQQVRRDVQASFGALPRGNYRVPVVPSLSFPLPTLNTGARDLPTSYVQGIYPAPPPSSPDADAMKVATSVLRDRLFEEIRVRRNLSYAPDAFMSSRAASIGGMSASTTDINQTVAVMLNEVGQLQQREVPAADLRSVAQGMLTSAFVDEQANAAQAGQLALFELVGGGWQRADSTIDRVRAVTPADVRRVAQTYMRNIQFVVVGQTENLDRRIFSRQP